MASGLFPSGWSDADPGDARLQDYKGAGQFRSVLAHQLQHWRIQTSCKYEPAKVLIFSQQYPVLSQREVHELLIDRAALKLRHRENVVTVCPGSSNCGEIAALIREKAHWPELRRGKRQDAFVRDDLAA
jgi:hypothetical protein